MAHCAHTLRFQDARAKPNAAELSIPFVSKGVPKFSAPRGPEAELGRRLREIARFTGQIVKAHVDPKRILVDEPTLVRTLYKYAETIEPWANQVTARLLEQVGTSNLRHWENASVDLGRALRTTYAKSEIGQIARGLHTRQVGLIKSLPVKAGERAQAWARKAQLEGVRPSAITEAIAELDRTGEVTEGRATLIARTEIAKANASFTEARARFVGSSHYIWRGMLDSEERDSHYDLEGEVFAWDDPPEIEGEGAHGPGDIWNCRCFAEPILTGEELDQRLEALYQARADWAA